MMHQDQMHHPQNQPYYAGSGTAFGGGEGGGMYSATRLQPSHQRTTFGYLRANGQRDTDNDESDDDVYAGGVPATGGKQRVLGLLGATEVTEDS